MQQQDEITIIPDVCAFHCGACDGMDHHWMPESNDEIDDGEPFMVCKHCDAVRSTPDDDDDF